MADIDRSHFSSKPRSLLTRPRWWGLGLLVSLLGAWLVLELLDPSPAPDTLKAPPVPPNFVVIVADDLGAQDISVYQPDAVQTPALNQLAQLGVSFGQAFLTTSSCSASRASLLSGRSPIATGAPDLHSEMSASIPTMASVLREHGYYTAAIGKWHLGEALRSHFDRQFDADDASGSEHWVSELAARDPSKPFFFWLASRDPHIPYASLTPTDPYQAADARLTPFMPDTLEARQSVAQYYNEIVRLDRSVGQVIAELARQQVLKNTYIIFLSDNGAPFPREKTTLYDRGLQTPLIIAGPGAKAGLRNPALTSLIDLAPTVIQLAKLEVPESFQGKSFAARFTAPDFSGDQYIFAEQHAHGYRINERAVRSRNYLYIRSLGENRIKCLLEVQPMGRQLLERFRAKQADAMQSHCFGISEAEELYALDGSDPWQVNNLAQEPTLAEIRQAMRVAMDEQAERVHDDRYPEQAPYNAIPQRR